MFFKKHSITLFWILIGITLCCALILGLSYSPTVPSHPIKKIERVIERLTPIEATSSEVSILIGGDIMLDRSIRKYGETYGYDSLFKNLTPLFNQSDIVVANLEGPITSSSSKTVFADGTYSKNLSFTFATSTGVLLSRVGISFVSLANNHTDNFGIEGFRETQNILTNSKIGYFGTPWNATGTEATTIKNGIPIAFVGYHQFQQGFGNIVTDVQRLSSQGYFIIVMPHWGTEYATTSSPLQQKQAQELVAAGANLIVGAHPHVIQEHGFIGNTPVYYSLGNLIFDQYFSPDVMKGNIIRFTITKDTRSTRITRTTVYEVNRSKTDITIENASEY